MTAPEARTVLTLHKAQRRIEISLADDAETEGREGLLVIVNSALDVLAGKKKSVCEPERFALLRKIVP